MKVLVTDGESRAALAVTRSLGRAGHDIYVSSATRRSLAGSSRYCRGRRVQAATSSGPRTAGSVLKGLIHELRPDLVFGVTDPTITVLHGLVEELPAIRLPAPRADHYFNLSDKVVLFQRCRQIGVAVPDGVAVQGGELPDSQILDSLGTPFVVRPGLSWRAAVDRWVVGQVSLENDAAGLEARVRDDPALSYPYLIQRRIEGDGCGLFVLALDGRLVRVFSHRRLREKPPWGGVSTLCVSEAPPSDLVGSVRRYVEAENWSGLAMFEFKRDGSDGQAYLLEGNARPWGSMSLALACGLEFPSELVRITFSGTTPDSPGYVPGRRLRWWWGDVDHFYLTELNRGRGRRAAMLRALSRAVCNGPWNTAWDTFRVDDPIPFVTETLTWLKR